MYAAMYAACLHDVGNIIANLIALIIDMVRLNYLALVAVIMIPHDKLMMMMMMGFIDD